MIKGSYDFMTRNPSRYHLIKSGGHRHCGNGDIISGFSFYYDLARPHDQSVIGLYGQDPIIVSYNSVRFGGRRRSGRGDIMLVVCHMIL